MNTQSPLLENPRVRIALSQAIDRPKLIKTVIKTGFPADRFTPSAMPGYPQSEVLKEESIVLSNDEIAALEEQGPIKLLVSNRDLSIALAESLQQIWSRQLGIDVRIQNMEFKSFLTRLDDGDYHIAYLAWFGDYLDPITFLDIWRSDSQYNRARWRNPEFDQLLLKSSRQSDPHKRRETLYAAESLLMKEMPIIPLFWKSRDYLISPRVKNWPKSLIDLRSYKHITLEN